MSKVLPVMLSFIVMGFVDIVGVSAGYVKQDFNLSNTLAQLIPSMAFIWFFLLSVPTGILQDRYGKRFIINVGMGVTGLGMLLPLVSYSFPVMLATFVLLGIGNTIVQVAANPLLQDVVPGSRFASFMSFSQFIKAICSLLGPILATFFASRYGDWKLVLTVYAVTSFLAVLWMYFTPIAEAKPERKPATFASCFRLLKSPFILLMVVGIFFVVGCDVGMNTNIAYYLKTAFGLSLEDASLGISVYFTALMIGRFSGAVILNWIRPGRFLILTTLIAIIGLIGMILAPDALLARVFIFITGLGSANLFPLIFTISLEKMPDRANEVSGLMIMAVAGGAVLPLVVGAVSESAGLTASLMVLVAAMGYILVAGFLAMRSKIK
ncbi:MAG TPA: MFS transporter [Bacteroidales bacterium]|nr:MFS transporter [Bacteroidales bacterium]HSA44218.1 MFS transporter [Bacteroidales bacterium]